MNCFLLCLILFGAITLCLAKKDDVIDTSPPAKGKSFFLFGAIFRRFRQRWMGGYNEPGSLYAGATFPLSGYYNCLAYGCNPVYSSMPPPQISGYYNQPYYSNSPYLQQPLQQQQQQQQQQHHQSNVVIYHHQDRLAQQYPQQYQTGPIPMPVTPHPGPPPVVFASSGPSMNSNYPGYAADIGYQNYPPTTAHQNSLSAYQSGPAAVPPFIATTGPGAHCGTPIYLCGSGM